MGQISECVCACCRCLPCLHFADVHMHACCRCLTSTCMLQVSHAYMHVAGVSRLHACCRCLTSTCMLQVSPTSTCMLQVSPTSSTSICRCLTCLHACYRCFSMTIHIYTCQHDMHFASQHVAGIHLSLMHACMSTMVDITDSWSSKSLRKLYRQTWHLQRLSKHACYHGAKNLML